MAQNTLVSDSLSVYISYSLSHSQTHTHTVSFSALCSSSRCALTASFGDVLKLIVYMEFVVGNVISESLHFSIWYFVLSLCVCRSCGFVRFAPAVSSQFYSLVCGLEFNKCILPLLVNHFYLRFGSFNWQDIMHRAPRKIYCALSNGILSFSLCPLSFSLCFSSAGNSHHCRHINTSCTHTSVQSRRLFSHTIMNEFQR